MSGLRFEITAENAGFIRRIEETQRSLRETRNIAEQSGSSLSRIFSGLEGGLTRIALLAGSAFSATKAIQLARECVNVRAEVETLEISFGTLLKSEEKAASLIKEIKTFASTTPMDMGTLAQGAQTMLAFNIEAEKIIPLLKSIGDISMGDASKFNSLALAFSQMSSTGKLMGQDLMQMINAGFNPLAEISRKTGKSIGELKEEVEKGKISVDMVTDAFMSATAEGGQFNGMLAKQAEGLNGSFAYLRGAISDMMNDIGSSMEGTTVSAVNMGAELVKNYKEVAQVIAVLVSMYGSYKTAVILTTAAEAAQTSGTTLLAASKSKLLTVVRQLYATMTLNPYGLLLAGVVALGYGIFKLTTYQTDYQKSLEKVSIATNEATVASEKEIKTLDELNAKLSTCSKGSKEWKSVKDAIVKQFGQYIPQLDEEITKVGNLSTAYNDLRIAIQQANAAKGLKSFIDSNDNTEDISAKFRKALSDWKDSAGKLGDKGKAILEPILREYSISSASDQDIFSFVQDKLKQSYGVDTGGQLYDAYEYFLKRSNLKGFNEAHAMNASREREIEKYVKDMGISKDDYNQIRFGIEKPSSTTGSENRKYWEQEVKNRTEAYNNLLKTDKAASEEALKSLKEAEAKLAEYNDYKAQNRKTADPSAAQLVAKEENAAGKLADVIRRQAQERLRIEQDYEYERWQSRIDLMDEGEKKILAQQELDFAKERTALERRKDQDIEAELQRQMALFDAQENVKAAGNKNYVKETFRDSDISQKEFDEIEERYKTLFIDLEYQQKKAESNRLDASKDSMNAYLKEFGDYQQKRLAIQKEYEKRISEAQNDGERMMFIGQRNKALSDLDYDEWVETGEIALAFGDIQNLSSDTVTKLISDMEKYREKVIATFDPEKIQKYEDALSSLRNIKTEDSFGIFSSAVPDYFKQRKSIGSQIDSAGSNLNALETQMTRLRMEAQALKNSTGLTRSMGGDTSEMESRLMEVNVQLSENENAIKKARNAFRALQEQWDSLDTPEAKFYALCDSIIYYADLAGGLASQASEMAKAMGADGLASALGTLSETMNSVENIASGFANGGIIGGIAAGVGEVMKWTTKLFQVGDNKKQKNIERLQEQIDALNKSYEKLGKLADDAFSTDASDLIDQQNTLLKQQQTLIRQQMAEEEAKKKTDDDKIKQYREQLQELDETIAENVRKGKEAIIGEDLKSAINEFASLYAEAWNDGTDAARKSMAAVKDIISSALSESLKKDIQPASERFYDALAEAMEDGVLTEAELDRLDAIKREMDALAAASEEQWKTIQERYRDLDEIKEELTEISFDSVRENFKSLLSDMESSTADFTDSFSDMLRNALIEGLMSEKYDLMLREWHDEFAEAMQDRTLTDTERDALRQQYDAIVQEGLADRDFINSIVGGGAYSQEATRGGWETMGQDQAEELNGRFTALTELEAINNTLVSEGNMIAAQILDTLRGLSSVSMGTDGDNSTLRDIRDMMFLSTGHLEDISKYTKQLVTIREGIDKLNDLINQRL